MKVYVLSQARKINDKKNDWERPVNVGVYKSLEKAVDAIKEKTHNNFSQCLGFPELAWMSPDHMFFVNELNMDMDM